VHYLTFIKKNTSSILFVKLGLQLDIGWMEKRINVFEGMRTRGKAKAK
jgi:hypothetical protein